MAREINTRILQLWRRLRSAVVDGASSVRQFTDVHYRTFRTLPQRLQVSIGALGILFLSAAFLPVSAATVVLIPSGLTGFPQTACTWAVNCTSYTPIADASSPTSDTATFIGTGTSGSGGEVIDVEIGNQANVASATQVVVHVHARSATIGSTADTIGVQVSVGGTALGTSTHTMTTTYTTYTATYTGSWTQAQVDNMQVQITRNVVGGGQASGRDDDVQVANVYVDMTYTSASTVQQAGYRFYENASNQSRTYIRSIGVASSEETVNDSIKVGDATIVAGHTNAAGGAGLRDAYIGVLNSSDNVTWSQRYGGTGNDEFESVAVASNGDYIVTGLTTSFGATNNDGFIMRISSSGTVQWTHMLNGGGNENYHRAIELSNGNIAVIGVTSSYGAGGIDILIAQYSGTGTLQSFNTYGSSVDDGARDAIATGDGGFLIAGDTRVTGVSGLSDGYVAKFNNLGQLEWDRSIGSAANEIANSVSLMSDGSIIVTMSTTTTPLQGQLVKLSSTGTIEWFRLFGAGSAVSTSLRDATEMPNGNISVVGTFTGTSSDAAILEVTSAGAFVRGKTIGGSSQIDVFEHVYPSANEIQVVGTSFTYSQDTNRDAIAARLANDFTLNGCTTECGTISSTDFTNVTPSQITPNFTAASPTVTSSTPTFTVNTLTLAEKTYYAFGPQVGTPLAAFNTAVTTPEAGTPFRLRLNLAVSIGELASGSYKLRFATRDADGVCDNDETYADVTTTSLIRFYDNGTWPDGIAYSASADDPTRSGVTAVGQTYEEANNFSVMTAIPAGQDGLWDFALTLGDATANTSYCIKATDTANANLSGGYASGAIATLTTPAATIGQGSYRFFGDSSTKTTVNAQALGGSTSDSGDGIIAASDGGYAVTGSTTSYGAGSIDLLLAKYDSSGTLSWTRTLGGSSDERGYDLVQTSDGGFVVTGSTNSYGAGSIDLLLAKYDSSGTLSWTRTIGGTGNEWGEDVVQTSDGGFAVVGQTTSYGAGSYDLLLAKYDSSGTLSWVRTVGGTGIDYGVSITTTSDGGFAVGGYTDSYGAGSYDLLLAKYDSSGTLSWTRTLGGTNAEYGYGIVQASDGSLVIAGRTSSYGAGGTDLLLAKYDSSGTLSWTRTLGGSSNEYVQDIVNTTDNGFAVVGQESSYGAGGTDLLLAKYDSSGTLSWTRTLGGSGSDTGKSLSASSDDGFIATGNTASYGVSDEILLAKFDSAGQATDCPADVCESPTPSTSSPTPTTGSPTPSTSSPTPTVTIIAGGRTIAGSALAAQDTAATIAHSTPFRLRSLASAGGVNLAQSGQNLKLQYAEKSGTCDPSFSGESYTYVGKQTLETAATLPQSASMTGFGAPWSNTSYITSASDGLAATVNPTSTSSSLDLRATNFGFTIPADATLRGVAATINRSSSASGDLYDSEIMLVSSGNKIGNNKALGALWPTTAADATFGGVIDQWGTALTPSQVNASDFGLSIKVANYQTTSRVASVFHVRLTIYYEAEGPIRYHDNPSLTDALGVSASANDPVNGTRPRVYQNYRETDPYTNAIDKIPAGSDGLWDFSLTSTSAADGKAYCLRTVKSDGTPLDTYTQIPEVQIGTQGGGGGGPQLPDLLRGGQSVINGVRSPFSF